MAKSLGWLQDLDLCSPKDPFLLISFRLGNSDCPLLSPLTLHLHLKGIEHNLIFPFSSQYANKAPPTGRELLLHWIYCFLDQQTYTPHGEPGSPGHVLPFLMFHCSLSALRRDQAFRLISPESDYPALLLYVVFPYGWK